MNNIKILQFLLDNKSSKFTINQISKNLNINYRIAHEQTKKLFEEGLINMDKVGNSFLCSFSGNFNEKVFLAEYFRTEYLLKKRSLRLIRKRFGELTQTYILLLIGSYSKNKQTKHSDIDLLAISNNKKDLVDVAELIPGNIHLTVVTPELFSEMILSKEISIGNEALKNNHILIGIDSYYRLINNVIGKKD